MNKKNIVLLFTLFVVFTIQTKLYAQVTIGTDEPPEKAALLDIKNVDGGNNGNATTQLGGFLLPRVELDDIREFTVFTHIKKTDADYDEQKARHKGLVVYNITPSLTNNIEEGIYVWTGAKWEKASFRQQAGFIYMPSIVLSTKTAGYEGRVNLYDEYKKQFEAPIIKNSAAPVQIPFFASAEDLHYYITAMDETVFDKDNTTISNDGWLEYKVKAASTDGTSYMNIVFVPKYQY
jgi:hypothetical protein